jgi:hypothetical protein
VDTRNYVSKSQVRIRNAASSSRNYVQVTESSGTTPTLTTAEIGPGTAALIFSGQTAAVTATTPTAVQLAAAFKVYFNREPLLNEGYELLLVNNNTSSGTVTLAVGTGVTALQTLPAQAITTTRRCIIFFSGVTPGAETAKILVN